eukprot:scaffold85757_cov26-Tisochrysis_lutea.AAC.1
MMVNKALTALPLVFKSVGNGGAKDPRGPHISRAFCEQPQPAVASLRSPEARRADCESSGLHHKRSVLFVVVLSRTRANPRIVRCEGNPSATLGRFC